MTKRLVTLLLLNVLSLPLAAEEWPGSFDVDAGSVAQLLSLSVTSGTRVQCEVDIEETRFGKIYAPSFSIAFSSVDRATRRDEKHAVFRSSVSISDDKGKVFYLNTINPEGKQYESAYMGLKPSADTVTIFLSWRDDGVFTYRALSGGEFGQGYLLRPDIKPEYANIFASGMRGTYTCTVDLPTTAAGGA